MEVSGQLHGLVAYPRGESHQYLFDRRSGRGKKMFLLLFTNHIMNMYGGVEV
jgi:hypothetical protein